MNRVDLISRTITTLDRMSRENEKQKALLSEMSKGGNLEIAAARQAIKDDRVSIGFFGDSLNVLCINSHRKCAFPMSCDTGLVNDTLFVAGWSRTF